MILPQILSVLFHCGGGGYSSEACIAGADHRQLLEARWIRSRDGIEPAKLDESDIVIPLPDAPGFWKPWSENFAVAAKPSRRLFATKVFVPLGARRLVLETEGTARMFQGDSLRIYLNGFLAGAVQDKSDSVIALDPSWLNRGTNNDLLLVAVSKRFGMTLEVPRIVSDPDTSLRGMKLGWFGDFGYGYSDSGSPSRFLKATSQLLLSCPRNGSAEIHPYNPVGNREIDDGPDPDIGFGHFKWSSISDVYWYQGWHRRRRVFTSTAGSTLKISIHNNGVCGAESSVRIDRVVPEPFVAGSGRGSADTVDVNVWMFNPGHEDGTTSFSWHVPALDPGNPPQYRSFSPEKN